jgi:8-oxo-dGTP diphosphatase
MKDDLSRRLLTRVGVKGLLFRGERLLLLRRTRSDVIYPGRWDLPGGGVERGSSLATTLRREFVEETGLRVRVGRPFDVRLVRIPVRGGPAFTTVQVTLTCTSRDARKVRIARTEHDEARWVSRSELSRIALTPPQAGVIRAALRARPRGNRREATRGP